jgi:hypothetical protein
MEYLTKVKSFPGIFFIKFIEINKTYAVLAFHHPQRKHIHKLFTEIPFFPLAFSGRVGYSILALSDTEC